MIPCILQNKSLPLVANLENTIIKDKKKNLKRKRFKL